MQVYCQACRHTFDAPPPPTPSCCPRCFSPSISPAGPFPPGPSALPPSAPPPPRVPLAAVERTLAVDPGQVPPELRGVYSSQPSLGAPPPPAALPPTSGNPFGSPLTSPHGSAGGPFAPAPLPPVSVVPASGPFPPPYQPSPYPAQPSTAYAAPPAAMSYPVPQAPSPMVPYGQPVGFQPMPGLQSAPDHTFAITVSLILAILAFLGACNPIGIVGIVFAILAYQATGTDPRAAASRAKVALYTSITAFVLTGAFWLLVVLGALSGA